MTISPEWRYIGASVAGTSHERTGQPCQDTHAYAVARAPGGPAALVMAVADGAGSAEHAEQGAEMACDSLLAAVTAHIESGGTIGDLTRAWAEGWLAGFQAAIAALAAETGAEARDFACTLLAVAVGEDEAALFQIGDGAIVIALRDEPGAYYPGFWPEQGEHVNVTTFLTQPDAAAHIQHDHLIGQVDEVALLTDGLQRLALDYQANRAHGPFFNPMFAPLRAAPPGCPEDLTVALATFLASETVNQRTDDDKTLTLATRRPVEPPASVTSHAEDNDGRIAAR